MNKEEILNKYIDLIDKGYCSDCNELNCIDNFPHAKITHGIRELQQENQKYKEVIDKAIETLEKGITFCENDSQGIYNKCNISINREKKVLDILKEVSE